MKLVFVFIALSLSLGAFAEARIVACGKLKLEESMDRSVHRNKRNFAIYANLFRFELAPSPEQIKRLMELTVKANALNLIPSACVDGWFGGDYTYTGFSSGGERINKLKARTKFEFERFEFYINKSKE